MLLVSSLLHCTGSRDLTQVFRPHIKCLHSLSHLLSLELELLDTVATVNTPGPLEDGQSILSICDRDKKTSGGQKIMLWFRYEVAPSKAYVLKILASIWWYSGNLGQKDQAGGNRLQGVVLEDVALLCPLVLLFCLLRREDTSLLCAPAPTFSSQVHWAKRPWRIHWI